MKRATSDHVKQAMNRIVRERHLCRPTYESTRRTSPGTHDVCHYHHVCPNTLILKNNLWILPMSSRVGPSVYPKYPPNVKPDSRSLILHHGIRSPNFCSLFKCPEIPSQLCGIALGFYGLSPFRTATAGVAGQSGVY